MEASGPNAEQIAYWTTTAGPKWVAWQALLDAQIDALGRAAMDLLPLAAGARVIDVGCGCGQSVLELAERVGPHGHVLGVDVSAPMLARAAERVRAAGYRHVELREADAQTHAFAPGAADAVFSRFGVMFFADPTAAFANLRRALQAGGRLAFVCWQPLERNPWMAVPLAAAAAHLALPPPPPAGAPGPFALGAHERITELLAAAGFSDVRIDGYETTLQVGGTADLDAVTDFVLQLGGPLVTAVREAAADVLPRVRSAVRAALAAYWDTTGVRMPAASWLVGARQP